MDYTSNKPYKPTASQTLRQSEMIGMLATAKGLRGIPADDPAMIRVIHETRDNHVEMMDHIRAWTRGYSRAAIVAGDLLASERRLDMRLPLPREPGAARPYRFPRGI